VTIKVTTKTSKTRHALSLFLESSEIAYSLVYSMRSLGVSADFDWLMAKECTAAIH